MTKIARLSRQGLAECPGCSRHVRIELDVGATACPFCGATGFQIERIENSAASRIRAAVWGPKTIAAAMIGVALLAASCEDTTDQPLYGIPPGPDSGIVDSGAADAGIDDAGIVDGG